MEANACGTPFVALEKLAALPETGAHGALIEVPAVGGQVDITLFAASIRNLCENAARWEVLSARAQAKRQDWQDTARIWQKLFDDLPAARPAPRQSLALCMVVKNAADTLAQTVGSVADICSEIIIGVDETTTDDTVAVCRKLGAKIIPVTSPLESGFDAARNTVMDYAAADWLLWLDSDESIDQPHKLVKYLQNSPVEAFAVPQYHFATEPLGLLKTDYPARLFRNRRGFSYFGMVHEHPEKGLNQGLGRAVKITEVGILHQGYLNEEIRRRRFKRNWPLLKLDRAKYPHRHLGQMLWLRDLAHLLRYRLEQNQKPVELAQRILAFWQETFAPQAPIPLLLEALPYYSEAVQYLHGQHAVEIGLSLVAGRAGVNNKSAEKVYGCFPDVVAAGAFMAKVTANSLNDLNAKYF